MKSAKRLLAGTTAALLILGLAACGSSGSSSESAASGSASEANAASSESSVSSVSTSSAGSEDIDLSGVTLRVAAASAENAQGLLIAAGLDDTPYEVDFTVMQGGNLVMEALAADQIDLGTGSQIPPLSASQAANGGNFKIIAVRHTHTLEQELIIPADSDITSVADLKGKTVGYVKNTTAHYFLEKMLEEAGLEWEDINATPLTTSDGLSAILSGDIDALASYGNAVRSAKARGAQTLESADEILSGDYYWYASLNVLEDETLHAAVTDYLQRYHEAAEWARQNPEAYAESVSSQTGEDYDEVLELFLNGTEQTKTRILPNSEETIASEQDIADTFYKLGVLDTQIDVSELFDHSFDEAVSAFPEY